MKPKKICMQKTCHGEEKDKKRQGFDLKIEKLYLDEEKYYSTDLMNYKEINPYQGDRNPKRVT